MGPMGWLTGLRRGRDEEIGWDDLVTRVVDALAPRAHYGARGAVVFAAAVHVTVAVPERSLAVARGFVDDPRFDREVGAGLANRCDVPTAELPLRDYAIVAGARAAVTVVDQAPRPWQLTIVGGDLAGRVVALPAGAPMVVFGRGAGGAGPAGTDLVVCERTSFVSRRAGALHREGQRLEVAALDQGDLLLVRRVDGEVVRPARTARGRVVIGDGDAVELGDGHDQAVRLVLRRAQGA